MPRRIALVAVVLAGVGILGVLAANALSSPASRTDPPLKSQTYADPAGDNPGPAPDVTGVLAENWSDGTIGFKVLLSQASAVVGQGGVGVYIDTDANRTTGQFGDDYFIAANAQFGGDPVYELDRWTGTTWTHAAAPSLTGEYHQGNNITVTIGKADLPLTGSTFNFDVWASAVAAGTIYSDQAPDQPNFFSYTLGTAQVTTTTATTTTTTTTPKPAEKLAGHVGPGATITLTHSARAGKAAITIDDRSARDNFDLAGPGVSKKTGVAFKGRVTWSVTLRKGKYAFRSDAHKTLHGTLTVS